MQKLKTSLKWLDNHLLKILVIGFIFIIPLYPKLPFRMINYTYIAIRLEDFYLVFISLIYAIQFLRRKVRVPWTIFILFILYWIAVFSSYLYGYYVQETIIINHLGFLHSLRRVEYMIIFLIAFSTIRSKKDFYTYLNFIFAVLLIVGVYGFGQRFAGWPAVQTMNPEYAKGYILVLDAWARVSSTFAGHYDLAGYLVLLMPIVLGCYMAAKKKIYFALYTLSLGLLILTASRASYFAYLIATIPFTLYVRKYKLLVLVLFLTLVMTPLSDNLTNRITRTLQSTQIFVNFKTGDIIVPRKRKADSLPPGNFGAKNIKIASPPAATATTIIPTPTIDSGTIAETKALIRETVVDEAEHSGKTLSPEEINALVENIFGSYVPVKKNLLDISISTRFQVSWPRAINAFLKNIYLGSGPSSLGEATDGDYLRWFGELGLVGTSLFLTILGVIFFRVWRAIRFMAQKTQYIFYGFLFGFISIFINAGYIDLFEASKLAYTFWLVAGIFYGALPYAVKKASVDKLKI